MKVFITGDCHSDFKKFAHHKFNYKDCSKEDTYMIICGDFGGIFLSKSLVPENPLEKDNLDWLSKKPMTFIVVGGNHENYDAIEANYPLNYFNGAKCRYIRPNIVWIERGEVFTLNGKKFWCFGGAYSMDKAYRKENISWWKREEPSDEEMEYGLQTLKNDRPDYIITHECPASVNMRIYPNSYFLNNSLTIQYMERILWQCEEIGLIPKWYFGHHHMDWDFGDFVCTYNRIIPLNI